MGPNSLHMLVRLAVALTITGCALGVPRFDQIMMEKVTTKASFDFQCGQKDLVVSKVDSGSYGAVGCGKRATYVGKDPSCSPDVFESHVRERCQVVTDTFAGTQQK